MEPICDDLHAADFTFTPQNLHVPWLEMNMSHVTMSCTVPYRSNTLAFEYLHQVAEEKSQASDKKKFITTGCLLRLLVLSRWSFHGCGSQQRCESSKGGKMRAAL